MLKIYSNSHNAEIIINPEHIKYILPNAFNNASNIYLDEKTAISTNLTITELYNLLEKDKLIVQPPPLLEKKERKPRLTSPLALVQDSGEKIYPDEFPDHFPRYRDGRLVKNSKLYLQYLEEKENGKI